MKITKLEHACLDVSEGNSRLIIDPGIYAASLHNLNNVTAVVITHVHPDHLDEVKVKQIVEQNPNVSLFSTQEVATQLPDLNITVPKLDETYKAGDFVLEFFGGEHAIVLPSFPRNQNYGVLVNDKLYYPGDSFAPCPKPHAALAIPAMGPWMKISESADFVTTDTATEVFPTHNGFLNDKGEDLLNRILGMTAEASRKQFHALKPGDPLEA